MKTKSVVLASWLKQFIVYTASIVILQVVIRVHDQTDKALPWVRSMATTLSFTMAAIYNDCNNTIKFMFHNGCCIKTKQVGSTIKRI